MKLKGYQAIEAKRQDDTVILCKYNDPFVGARENLTVEEAMNIAREHPSLVYAEVVPVWYIEKPKAAERLCVRSASVLGIRQRWPES